MTARVFYEVACNKHGQHTAKNTQLKSVIVGRPAHKQIRGCPLCAAERKKHSVAST